MEIRRALSNDLESILKINENVYSGLDYLQILLSENGFPWLSSLTLRHALRNCGGNFRVRSKGVNQNEVV